MRCRARSEPARTLASFPPLLFVGEIFPPHTAERPVPRYSLGNNRMLSVTTFFSLLCRLSDTPGSHYPHGCFTPVLLRRVNATSSSSPEVEFRINHLKQSMHIISTPRPGYTNTSPLVVYFFFFPPSIASILPVIP